MDKANFECAVLNAVTKETGIDCKGIDLNKDFRKQVHLDSMQFVAIIARLEIELNIDIPVEALACETLKDFVDVIYSNVASQI